MSETNFDNSMDLESTPPEIKKIAEAAVNDLMPTKSSSVYYNSYHKFMDWCKAKNVKNYSESVLLGYFLYLATELKMKCSTMWSHYSMIKSLLNLKHGVNISKYMKLRAFLKKKNEGFRPKKSRVFSKEQFEKFLSDAPDEKYLASKVVFVIGISGACRCDELVKMRIEDIEDLKTLIHIKIPDSKTYKARSFSIIGEKFINIIRKYLSLRPNDINNARFFVKYSNGKCQKSLMGIHKISSVPKEVATFLKLPNATEYTGHCLRRTSATLLVDGGANLTCLKRHGGWKSSSVAEGYIEESLVNKNEIANKILGHTNTNTSTSTSSTSASLNLNACTSDAATSGFNFYRSSVTNCSFHINVTNNK